MALFEGFSKCVFQNTEYSVFPVTRWLGNSHLIKI